MIKPRFNKILDLLTECAYLGVVFLVPLYFSIVPKTANVFELNKIVLFRVLVLLMFLFGFSGFLFKENLRQRFLGTFNSKKSYLVIPAFYLLGLSFLTFFSSFPSTSFWGSYDRQMGLYSYFYFFIFFCFLVLYVEKKEQVNRILYTISLSSFFVCVYGVVQISGYDPLDWFESTNSRIFSSLGQPNFLASFLLLAIPISAFLFIDTKRKLQKIFFGFSFLLQLLCLVFTYSRAGILGLFTGIFLFLVAFFLKNNKGRSVYKIKKQTFLILILGLLIGLSFLWFVFPINQKNRLKMTFDLQQGGLTSRADYWQASWMGFCEKPLWGYGLENQEEIMAKYYQKDWAVANDVNTINDRAHNIILDTLLTGGILGGIIYIILNLYFVRLALENIKKNYYTKLSLAILFAWTCYSVSLLFGFSVLVTEIYFWLYLAILVLANVMGDSAKEEFVVNNQKSKNVLVFLKVIVFLAVLLGVVFQLNRELKIVIADIYFYKLESSLSEGQYFTAYVLYDWIKELKVRDNYYDRSLARGVSQVIEKNTGDTWSEAAKKIIFPQALHGIASGSYKDVCVRAKVYAAMASEKNQEFYNKAEEDFKLCIEKGENIPESYREFAKYYFKKGDYGNAVDNLNTTLSLLPDLSDQRINNDHASEILRERFFVDVLFGDVYVEKKNYDLARKYYSQASEESGSIIFINKKIADSYYLEGEKEKAIEVLDDINRIDGANYFWSFKIAQVYLEINDNNSAIEYARKAFLLSPNNKQVENLLNTLTIKEK